MVEVLQQKWQQHDDPTETMRGIVRKWILAGGDDGRPGAENRGAAREVGELFRAILNDMAQEIPSLESDSVGLIHVDSLRQSL